MPTLYELTGDYMTLLSMATDPEIDPQAITDTLEAIGGEIETRRKIPRSFSRSWRRRPRKSRRRKHASRRAESPLKIMPPALMIGFTRR